MRQLEDLIFRNIEATKKRGQIHSRTSIKDFIAKLKEEIYELDDSFDDDNTYDPLEAADVFLVAASMIMQEGIYPYVLQKVEINEQRAMDIMPLSEAIKIVEEHEKWRQGGDGLQTVPAILTRATASLLSFARSH